MNHKRKAPIASLLFLLALTIIPAVTWQEPSDRKQILILHSYHQGYKWTDDILRGIEDVFQIGKGDVDLRVEYLDTKHISDEAYLAQVYQVFQLKYQNTKIDLIISSDDSALNFLLKYADSLFPGVPVVFCGANFFDERRLANHDQFAGVSEEADIQGTLDIALKLHPNTRQVVVVNDTTVTGRILHERIVRLTSEYPRVVFTLLEDITMDDIRRQVSQLPPDSLVIITIFTSDKAGNFFEYNTYTSLISQSSRVPVYGTWDFSLGYGIVGGKLTSGYSEGQRAAQIAQRILRGESPSAISVVKQMESRYMFDDNQLQRFHIRISDLPPDSVVINRPDTLYERYKEYIWLASFSLLFLLVIIVVLMVNIRRRKRTEESLRESEMKYRRLVDTANEGIWVLDEDRRTTFVNVRLAEMLGFQPEEMLGRSLESFLYDEDVPDQARRMESRRQGLAEQYERRFRRKDGEGVWTIVSATPLFDARRHFRGSFGMLTDITERKRAEESLTKTHLLLEQTLRFTEALLSAIPTPVFYKDREGRYLGCNRAFSEIMGVTSEGIKGKTVYELWPSEQARTYHDKDLELMSNPAHQAYEFKVRDKDGLERPVIYAKDVFRNENDQVAGIVGAFLDITERKRAEEELTQHRAHLEELVEQRTAELVVAKEQAEAANRAKSAFLANMSHELRTPLNAVLGYAQLLQRDRALAASHLDAVNTIERSGQHLLTLITDILDLSKIEAGKLDLSPGDLYLPSFLQEIASLVYLRAESKELGFKYQPETDLPQWVQADEKRLRQVLINLLSNAVKFTDQGEVTFRVNALEPAPIPIDSQPAPTVCLRFEVIDTGVGLAADQLERIFLPFEQASNRPQYLEGTGLGLAISRQLVRAMGGDIHVSSTVGEGSTFWFDLVLPVIARGPLSRPAHPPHPISYRGPRRKALIVDDQPDNRLILIDLLHSLGFDLREAANGQQAIELARDWQPDLILMDMFMPVLSGFEATPRLRQMPELAATIIVGISAGVSEADTQHILQAGCHAALPKPIELTKLLAVLASHLKLEWMYTPLETPSSEAVEPGRELIPPPPEELAIWYDLAQQGNLRGIQERAARLPQLDKQYQPFADQVQHLARNFEDKALLSLIKRYYGEEGS